MKAIVVNFTECKISHEVTIQNWPNKVDEMYYATELGNIPVAYCFKPDSREIIEAILQDIAKKRAQLRQYEHDMIAVTMRQHRRDQ